ncbi:MAG: hypothetical protein QG616_2286 [Pseudomonadota bacterium]|nr:hypothetical protein [Pseudomonadota bacterium]
MAGLLDDPIAALAAQIRAQYNTGQGGSGSWDDAGYDRAMELAQLLAKQGITNLSDLALKNTPYDDASAAEYNRVNATGADMNGYPISPGLSAEDLNAGGGRKQLQIGDKAVGFLGDYNNDGTYGSNAGEFLQGKGDEALLGWSARGDGNTSYRVVTDPATGKVSIAPGWNSSSDADTARKLAIAAAVIAGGAYGASAMGGAGAGAGAGGGLTGVDAAMADYAASGGGAGLFGGGGAAAGGIGTLGTLPEVPGQVASMSTMGQFTMPELASAAYVPTMAELGAGAGGLLSGLGGAGALAKLGITALGAYEGYKGNDPASTTNVRTLDPRIDSRVFGDNGLLSNVDSWYQQNKSGQNETMKKAQDWTRGMLSSPEAQQGLARMYGSSQGLLSSPVAGNPFLNWKVGG